MRYKVTGGSDGVSGLDVGTKRYEAGDEVELTAKQAEWLLEQGYVESVDAKTSKAKTVVEEIIVEEETEA
jgi:hypothetical protein